AGGSAPLSPSSGPGQPGCTSQHQAGSAKTQDSTSNKATAMGGLVAFGGSAGDQPKVCPKDLSCLALVNSISLDSSTSCILLLLAWECWEMRLTFWLMFSTTACCCSAAAEIWAEKSITSSISAST